MTASTKASLCSMYTELVDEHCFRSSVVGSSVKFPVLLVAAGVSVRMARRGSQGMMFSNTPSLFANTPSVSSPVATTADSSSCT